MSSAKEPDSDNRDGSILNPTLIAKVQVEDETMDVLLDTRSPVTILSLNFIVNKWAQQKRESQSEEQWKEEVRGRLKAPSLNLKNYESGELNILTVKLKNGDHTCTAVVLLQKDPPHNLLLGTNFLSMLGFKFTQYEDSTGKAVDLLTDEGWNVCSKVQKPHAQNTAGISREVKLISATRVQHFTRE